MIEHSSSGIDCLERDINGFVQTSKITTSLLMWVSSWYETCVHPGMQFLFSDCQPCLLIKESCQLHLVLSEHNVLGSILMSWGYLGKIPQTRQLKQQKFMFFF